MGESVKLIIQLSTHRSIMNVYLCRFTHCGSRFYSARQLISHMKLIHYDTIIHDLTCNMDDCISIYHSVDAFRKHISRTHDNHWKVLGKPNFEIAEPRCSDDQETLQSISNFKQKLGQNITFSKLKTTEIHMLPKSTSTASFDNLKQLMNFYQFGFQNLVSSRLSAICTDFKSDDLLSEVLRPESHFESVTAI
jgi:hypothetical protein